MSNALPDRQITTQDGTTYTVRFSIKAMAALQDHYGLESIDAVGAHLATLKFGVDDIATLLWAGLRSKHEDVSPEQAVDILDEAGLEGLSDVLGSALKAAMPAAKGNTGGRKPGPTRRGR